MADSLDPVSDLAMPYPQPFYYLEHHATERAQATALSSFARYFTSAEAYAYATSIAALLRRRGVRAGDVVATQVRNEFNLLFMYAVFHEAAIFAPVTTAVHDSDPVGFNWLVSHQVLDTFSSDRTILVDDAFLAEVARQRFADAPLAYESFDSVCRLSFSSGTTGTPLAVSSTVERHGRGAVSWMDSRPFFSLIRGFSGSGVKAAVSSIYQGDVYICPGEPDENVTLAQRNFVSTLHGSPAQIAEFLDLLARRDNRHVDISTVQFIGSFLSERLLQRIHDELGASVTACYGSSEIGMVAMREEVRDNPADVGRPFEHATIEIVDENHQPVLNGVEGIVRIKTTRRSTNYFRAPDAVARTYHDGWFYPGDVGRFSPDGHLILCGRTSDVINAGGVKFNAALLDDFLTTHDDVRDGAIIPILDADGLDSYAALVVVDEAFDLSTLIEPLRVATGGVTPASIIRVGVITRNENGKVPRIALAERVNALLRHNSNESADEQ
jgi:acyl-coenzyme A synthetase/AMP-(fatty) acid ligase